MSNFLRPMPVFKKGPEAYNPVNQAAGMDSNIELRDIELDYSTNPMNNYYSKNRA
jgi:hypothetical protein